MIPNIYTLNLHTIYDIKTELLMKAHLDYSKYVIIERLHHPTDPKKSDYWERHYVLPNQVEAGDKILGNHHLLPTNHPQYKPAPKKVHGNTIPNDIKARVNAWEQKNCKDSASFIAAVKQLGITWKVTDKLGANYMFAKRALNRAVMNHQFDPDNPTDKIIPLSAISPSVNFPTVGVVNSQGDGTQSKRKKLSATAKAITNAFFITECNGDKATFYQKLKQFGITWTKTLKEGINLMFAKAALSARIDEGFDPKNPNAQPKSASTKPTTDASMLEVSDNATEREKNLIEFINKMTNIEDIQGCTRMGMVPEDDQAKQFILNQLQLKLAEAVVNPDDEPWFQEKDDKGKTKFPPDLRADITSEWGNSLLQELVDQNKSSFQTSYSQSPEGFSKSIVDQLELVGCKKHALIPGFEVLAHFNMDQIMNPRDYITPISIDPNRANVDIRIWDVVKSLNEAYADYTTDDYQPQYSTNLGYTGMDGSIYIQRYNINKEGFVRGLRKIAKDIPSLQSKTEEIISTYDEMMKTVGYNPQVLSAIMESPNWSTKPPDYYKVNQFGKKPCQSRGEAVQRVKDADRLSELVIGELTKRGYSQSAILDSLQNTLINDGLNSFRIKNNSGTEDIVDFSQLTGTDGKPIIYITKDVYWGNQLMHYTRAKYQQSQGLSMDNLAAEAMLHYNAAKKLAETSEDDYKKVHQLSMKLAGFKLVHHSGKDLDYSKVDVHYNNWQTYRSDPEIADESPEIEVIMANLRMHKLYHDINTEVVKNMSRNAASNFNDKGKNFAGNFDYYSGTIMSQLPSTNPRLTQVENDLNGGATYTAKQLSDKVNQQMEQVPGISLDYLAKLKTYYSKDGHHPKVDSFDRNWGNDTDVYLDSPIKDILYQVSQNVSEHIPATVAKPTFQKLTAKRLNYVPFDFNKSQQPRLQKPKIKPSTPPDPKELKAAREKLLMAAKCSLATEPENICKQMRMNFAGKDFDYVKGEKTIEGTVMNGPIHSLPGKPTKTSQIGSTYNQVPLFNSPFFKINNSIQQTEFQQKQEELKTKYPQRSDIWNPLNVFQGTSYWSAASILGKYGAFFMGNEVEKTSKMLGLGAYFASKIGKISPYVGNVSYAHRPGNVASSVDSNKDESNGICIMADIMRGEKYEKGLAYRNKAKLTSLSVDANPYFDQTNQGVRDFEIAVKQNNLISPHHIVDVSMRTIGYNIRRCPEGYRDMVTGKLLYDVNGVSLNMPKLS